VKILDFGLAKSAVNAQPGSDASTLTMTITDPGTTVGTVSYMSPEQARGEPNLTFQSDQFSFGLVLYQMASGKRAFERPSAAETMTAIIREERSRCRRRASAAALGHRTAAGKRSCRALRLDAGPVSRAEADSRASLTKHQWG